MIMVMILILILIMILIMLTLMITIKIIINTWDNSVKYCNINDNELVSTLNSNELVMKQVKK